jgi:hypothetical protein
MGGYLTTVMDENPSRHSDSIDPYAILIITTHGEHNVFDAGIAQNVQNIKFDNLSKIDAAPLGDFNCLSAETAREIVTHIRDENYLDGTPGGKIPVPLGDLIAPGMLPLQLQLLDPRMHFVPSAEKVDNPDGKYKSVLYRKGDSFPEKTYTIKANELTKNDGYYNDYLLIIGKDVYKLREVLKFKRAGNRDNIKFCITLSELLNQVYGRLGYLKGMGDLKTTIEQLCIVDLSCSRLRNGDEVNNPRSLRYVRWNEKKQHPGRGGGKKRRRVTRINKKNKKNKKTKKSTKHKRRE